MECHVLFLTPESFLSNAFVRRQIVVIASRLRPLRWLRHSLFLLRPFSLCAQRIYFVYWGKYLLVTRIRDSFTQSLK